MHNFKLLTKPRKKLCLWYAFFNIKYGIANLPLIFERALLVREVLRVIQGPDFHQGAQVSPHSLPWRKCLQICYWGILSIWGQKRSRKSWNLLPGISESPTERSCRNVHKFQMFHCWECASPIVQREFGNGTANLIHVGYAKLLSRKTLRVVVKGFHSALVFSLSLKRHVFFLIFLWIWFSSTPWKFMHKELLW